MRSLLVEVLPAYAPKTQILKAEIVLHMISVKNIRYIYNCMRFANNHISDSRECLF